MKVLIDECLPRQLKGWLSGYDTVTVQEAKWAGISNGRLLRLADGLFDVLVTADKNPNYQQNIEGMRISIVVIPTNRKHLVEKSVSALLQSLMQVKPGQKVVMELGADSSVWGVLKLYRVEDAGQVTKHHFGPK